MDILILSNLFSLKLLFFYPYLLVKTYLII